MINAVLVFQLNNLIKSDTVIDLENHWSTGHSRGVTWGPYKWPKINGFHWGEITLLIGTITRFISGWGTSCLIQVELRHGKSWEGTWKESVCIVCACPKIRGY